MKNKFRLYREMATHPVDLSRRLATFLLCVVVCLVTSAQTSYYKSVDPFIGSEGDGNVVVGPSCPFGMVKPGPDCDRAANSGYKSDLSVPLFGFSQVHVSGTGGGAKYGNVSVMPFSGDLDATDHTSLRANEKAACGYYSVDLLKHKISAEITATHKVACYRFGFAAGAEKAIQLDAGAFLNEGNNLSEEEAHFFVGSQIQILNDSEVCGYNCVRGGWNAGDVYTIFFHAAFDRPITDFSTWQGKILYPNTDRKADNGQKTGALMQFGSTGTMLQMKIAISFISEAKAKQNLQTEVPGWDFDAVRHQAEQKWEALLAKIDIDKNASQAYQTMFYTGLYHTMLMPVDRTGENPLWQSAEPYYDDFYAIWDTYRTSHPLITLIDEKRQTDIVRSLLDIYLHDGYMPDARSGNSNGRTQGGSNADVLIADAYAKGLTGIDYQLALKAMLKNADIPPGGNEEKEGRGGLPDYNTLGYVSMRYPRSGTRTVEYAYNDFCIASVAKGLGQTTTFDRFSKQANNWQNLWRTYSQHGVTGFIMPKDGQGKWVETFFCDRGKTTKSVYTPLKVEKGDCVCWWCGFLYEANSWEYSLSVPHDVAGLVQRCGGAQAFGRRLDTFFINKYYNVGNEPSFLSPTLYHWIGKPGSSSARIRSIIQKSFNPTKKGLPGNDDSGAMSSWLAFQMLGLFPNAGQAYYLINTPFFQTSTLHVADGKSFQIIAKGATTGNQYITAAKLNGKPLNRAWLKHTEIMTGGTLELQLGESPSNWGSAELPPSLHY